MMGCEHPAAQNHWEGPALLLGSAFPGSFCQDPFSRVPFPGHLFEDSFSRPPFPGSLFQDPFPRIPFPEPLCHGPFSLIPFPRSLSQDPFHGLTPSIAPHPTSQRVFPWEEDGSVTRGVYPACFPRFLGLHTPISLWDSRPSGDGCAAASPARGGFWGQKGTSQARRSIPRLSSHSRLEWAPSKQPQHLQPCGSSIPILFLLLIQPRGSNRGFSAAPEPANPGRSGASPDPIPNDQKMSEGEGNPQITSPHPGAEQEELNFGITRQELLQILFVQSCLNPPVQPFRCLLTRLGRENEFKT